MAETFFFGTLGKQDINTGYGTFSATLPDGSTATLDKVGLATWMGQVINAKEAGAAGNGSTDDRTTLNTLANTTLSAGGTIFFPNGTYVIGSNMTFPANVNLVFSKLAMLSPSVGVTVTVNSPFSANRNRIFTGSGTVSFGSSVVIESVFPEWWGATGDGSTNDFTALQAAVDLAYAANSNRGAVVSLTSATYVTNSQLVVRENVIVRGAGRIASRIKAGASFPTATALVLLGHSSETLSHGCRLENLMLDCNSIANSIGVASTKIQEFSGLFFVDIQNFKSKGYYFSGASQNYICDYVTLTADIAANNGTWIGADIEAGAAIFRRISHHTVVAPVGANTGLAGIRVDNCVSGAIEDSNIETVVNGVLIGTSAGVTGLRCVNINGQDVTNTINIANFAVSSVVLENILANGTTVNGILDNRNSNTLAGTVALYVIGNTGAPRSTFAIHSNAVQINGQTTQGALGIGLGGTTPVAKLDILTDTATPYTNLTTAATWAVTKYLAKIQTTGNTATALFTLTLSDNNDYTITAKVAARSATTGIGDGAMLAGNFYRNGGAAAPGGLLGTVFAAGTYTITINASGNDVRVMVTGLVGNTINWVGEIEVMRVNS